MSFIFTKSTASSHRNPSLIFPDGCPHTLLLLSFKINSFLSSFLHTPSQQPGFEVTIHTACLVAVLACLVAFLQSFLPALGGVIPPRVSTTSLIDETGAVAGLVGDCLLRARNLRLEHCGVGGRISTDWSMLQPRAQSAREETPHSTLLVVEGRLLAPTPGLGVFDRPIVPMTYKCIRIQEEG